MNRHLFTHESPSTVLLHLYGLSQNTALEHFQQEALDLVRAVLPFDSAMWGAAAQSPEGIDIHTIHLDNQPDDMLTSYEHVKHMDTAAQLAGARPRQTLGFNARQQFGQPWQAELLDYGLRFEQANFLITGDHDPINGLVHWITLFRADDDAHCTEAERSLLALLAPHVMQALTLNRMAHLARSGEPGASAAACRGRAICDLRGVFHHADVPFRHSIQQEGATGNAARLPAALLDCFLSGQTFYKGRSCVISATTEHGLLFLSARPRCRADDLTERELTVARLMAAGNTYKQIALLLHRSPATVRNQIRSLYGKLEVSHVAGVIEALREAA